jgi:hypothetical protein
MADARQVGEEAVSKKRDFDEWRAAYRIRGLEEYWHPNQDESDREAADAGSYFVSRTWSSDDISKFTIL